MNADGRITGRKVIGFALLAMLGAIAGMLVVNHFADALRTTPAWLGPALVIGFIALFVLAFLLAPALLRARRRGGGGPSA